MAERLKENLRCLTCLDTFKDPIILPCNHSFCCVCLQQWRRKGERACQVCKTTFRRSLENFLDFSQTCVKSEDICSLHNEELKLFCLDHKELVCLFCREAEIHIGHKIEPLEEVAKSHKEELEKGLQNADKRLNAYNDCRKNCLEQAVYIKVQSEKIVRKIKKDFEELRHFLDIEEDARLAAVREEERKKSQSMKETIAALGKEMATLSDLIRSTEEQLASDNVSFLKNFQIAMSRIQELPDKPRLPRGALLDEAKHVGNLKFNIWERMKETLSYSPVILDPNTAHPNLSLSEDLTSLTLKEPQHCPNNPERSPLPSVLGCALVSGRQVWDVEVEDNNDWNVGIIKCINLLFTKNPDKEYHKYSLVEVEDMIVRLFNVSGNVISSHDKSCPGQI
nr:E3 ubiquitin-protein ligase TRIM35-like [Nerophis lumbriciformis]